MMTLHWPFLKIAALGGAIAIASPVAWAEDPLQERTAEFYPLPRGGALTIEGADGSIHIYGWNEPRVRIAALRNAYTDARLHEIRVETNAEPAAITVHASVPPAHGIFADRSGTVDFTVNVPETARLELKLKNGEIIIEGLRGGSAHAELMNGKITALNCIAQVRAHTATGALELFYQWWENYPATFDFSIGYGTIRTLIPIGAKFRVDAAMAHGRIGNGFGFKNPSGAGPGQSLEAATSPDAPVALHFRDGGGNISIDSWR